MRYALFVCADETEQLADAALPWTRGRSSATAQAFMATRLVVTLAQFVYPWVVKVED